jgi:hypothetical protein
MPIKDGNLTALGIFDRHYTADRKHVRRVAQFVGPGEKFVLLTPDAHALFVWRKFIDDADDGSGKRQQGVNCAVFRREWGAEASELIRAADALADERWPGERHYTYVNPRKVRSTNPGYCFLKAGWVKRAKPYRYTKGGLLILERESCI